MNCPLASIISTMRQMCKATSQGTTPIVTKPAPATMVNKQTFIFLIITGLQVYFNFMSFTVSVHCKDTRIAVQVRTNKPFNGRIYALGRSETCNIDVVNSDLFRLDLTMAGQDCNTQSVVSKFQIQ